MSQKTYNKVTTASLLAIALSAILYDRIPRYGWLLGIMAGVCAIVSAWVYLAYGMSKDRANTVPPAVEDELNDLVAIENSTAAYMDAVAPLEAGYWPDIALKAVSKGFGKTAVFYSLEVPRPRTLAEEVVEIIKGLTALSETPMYELEIKADGTLKVLPCDQTNRKTQEGKALKQDILAIDAEIQTEEESLIQ